MMALEDVDGSMCESRLPHSRHRKVWVDLADATVPTGTSRPLSRNAWPLFPYAAASLLDQMKSVPSRHMRCRMTASFRATAILAFLKPMRFHSR